MDNKDTWLALLADFQKLIRYKFKDKELLMSAMTHASMNVQYQHMMNYEKLEFLGDRVLGLCIATIIYEKFSHESEGEMARRHAGLVCAASLHEVAKVLELGRYIRMTAGEENTGGRDNSTILSDAMEALIAAIYLDGGIEEANKIIKRYWHPLFESVREVPKDAKSALQEWAQKKGLPLPHYHILERTGSDHAPTYAIEVSIVGSHYRAEAKGNSKKEAEQGAAAALLAILD